MRYALLKACLVLPLTVFSISSFGDSPDGLWFNPDTQSAQITAKNTVSINAIKQQYETPYRTQQADTHQLRAQLESAPREGALQGVYFYVPMPNGEYVLLEVFRSSVMAQAMEEKFPSLKTYKVFGVNDESISGRIGFSANGFYGYLHTADGAVVIESATDDAETFVASNSDRLYRTFYTNDIFAQKNDDFSCSIEESAQPVNNNLRSFDTFNPTFQKTEGSRTFGDQLRVYRLALSMTGELSQRLGGTKAQSVSFIVQSVNVLNQIFERDVGIRLELVANNDDVVFTNPNTDPYTDIRRPERNVTAILNDVVGLENYDIGHVLSLGGGGSASVGQVCNDTQKAFGRSGISTFGPVWQYNAITILAHEIGHQFGALHSFNASSCLQRVGRTAWEMHSGSTLMGYAGICGPSLQGRADHVFHAGSQQQIIDYVTQSQGASCGSTINLDTPAPLFSAGADYTIPANTPFMLTALPEAGSNASALTYTWDQLDLGSATNSNSSTWVDDGRGPLFRSFAPVPSTTRVFPALTAIMADDLSSSLGEVMPTTNRDINFRVTARTSNTMSQDDVKLTVASDAGPFRVTQPSGVTFNSGETVTVRWQVAQTDIPPINCRNVDISLSRNGGNSFDIDLATETENDGNETVTLPSLGQGEARFRVMCSDNVFFAVSPMNSTAGNDSGRIFIEAAIDSIPEGGSGFTNVEFTVTRENTGDVLEVEYNIIGSANREDFVDGFTQSGILRLESNERTITFTVAVLGDEIIENDEFFSVVLGNPSSGYFADNTTANIAIVSIINDDVDTGIDDDGTDETENDEVDNGSDDTNNDDDSSGDDPNSDDGDASESDTGNDGSDDANNDDDSGSNDSNSDDGGAGESDNGNDGSGDANNDDDSDSNNGDTGESDNDSNESSDTNTGNDSGGDNNSDSGDSGNDTDGGNSGNRESDNNSNSGDAADSANNESSSGGSGSFSPLTGLLLLLLLLYRKQASIRQKVRQWV
ncbi:reprolysin-like metallopeptidase [Sessilibacter corallicola]|uniref:reprolysin-like metallopeptidase n=1 Tax=Sessilibacter corallicola TaxID=2904075 RepID=UPI001E54BCFB|nr:zinc-dependent metalloprotease family protein [Sessilibacter corallicola]MCE2028502.1 M12 family metallo-peptidase [Sessilibacter corallicola]